MKTLMGIMAVIALGAALTACDDRRHKKHDNNGRLPGDHGPSAPNCAADGPGCKQFNPKK
ncbi:hypothetical protein EOL70_04810 [Leucothrix sargassi]|nr:hypothetical protein EOL70_04810 [Leucothrix sargassi]